MKELIFNFHGVGEPPLGVGQAEQPYWLDEPSFKGAIDAIVRLQHTLDVPIRITFDDGNSSDALIAMPELQKRGLVGTFFICTGRIGLPNYLDAGALKEMMQAGMELGSHGVWHVDWRKTSAADLDAEVIGSKHQLEDVCSKAVVQAGIPFGSYDRRVLNKAKAAGYSTVFSSDGGFASQGQWLKPRLTLDRFWQEKDAIEKAAFVPSIISQLKRDCTNFYKRLR